MFIFKKAFLSIAIISACIAGYALTPAQITLAQDLKTNAHLGHGPAVNHMLTQQQQADLVWYLTERDSLVTELRKQQVECGIITPKALQAYLTVMNERRTLLMINGGIAPKPTIIQYHELKRLQDKLQQATDPKDKLSTYKDLLQQLIIYGLMNEREYKAHLSIMEENRKLQDEYKKHPEGMAYRERQTQQALFIKEFTAKLQVLNRQYMEKRVLNSSLSREDADKISDNIEENVEKSLGFARNQSTPVGVLGFGPAR